jgi:membrane-associated phospholipid phosphatase
VVWRSLRAAWVLTVSWVVAAPLGALLKIVFTRPRPSPGLVHVLEHDTGKSFPSGHAILYGWLAASIALVIAPRLNPRLRPVTWLLAALVLMIGCLGRVWAGVHWPSDVVGGALLAIACVALAAGLPVPPPLRGPIRTNLTGGR